MEQPSGEMSPKQSIDLISEMISQTRFNAIQSSFHLIFWGLLLAAIGIGNFALNKLGRNDLGVYLWFLTIPGFFVSLIYGFKTGRNAKVATYADGVFAAVWVSFAIIMFSAVLFLTLKEIQGVLIASFSMLLAGYATFLSGWILKFNPLKIGGIVFLGFSWAIYLVGGDISLLLSSLAVILGYVIPGFMLRNRG